MKFLLLTQYYPPESGSASIKMAELAEYLASKKHHVSVVTGFPNYPYGKVYKGYRRTIYKRETIKGVNVIRTPLFITQKRHSFKHRLMNHVSFMMTSIYGGLFSGKPELIYYYSPPLFLGFSAWVLGRYFRVPIVGEFNDLWPQAPITLGIIENKYIKKIAQLFEKFVYDKTNYLFFYSNTMREELINKGIPKNKTEIHPLWVFTDEFSPLSEEKVANIKRDYNLDGKFTIVYAGYIGLAQGIDIVLDVANMLKQHKDILFILIGEGPAKKELIKRAKVLDLKNIMFIPSQPKEEIPAFLSAADILFAHLDPAPHRLGTIPAKVIAYMSMGKPLIIAAQGETKNLVEESKGGIVAEPRKEEPIANAILSFYQDATLRGKMGVDARKYAIENFDANKLLPTLENRLIEIVQNKI